MDEEVVAVSGELGHGLIDLTGVNLGELQDLDQDRLARELRRLLCDKDTGPVAGFDSSI